MTQVFLDLQTWLDGFCVVNEINTEPKSCT